MRVLFIGSKDRGVRCLDALLNAGVDVPAVVTSPDDDPDAFWEGSVEEAATDAGIPAHTPAEINDPTVVDRIRRMDVDLIAMSGYNQIPGGDLPVTESVSDRILTLPFHLELSVGDLDYIAEAVRSFFENHSG